MRKKQRDPLQAGLIIKQLASVLSITIDELKENLIKKTNLGDDSIRHYLMGEAPWPFAEVGYDDCQEIVYDILREQQLAGKLSEEDIKGKRKEVEKILKVAFMDIDTFSFHGREEWKSTENPINSTIDWLMRDIDNLDIETRYVLNRYFDAFSSITERDLKWIDYLDCLGYDKNLPSWKEFERKLSKDVYAISSKLILENVGNKAFGQWLELLSRKGYKDTTRKMDNEKVEKLKTDIRKKLYLQKEDIGLGGLVSLLNFIHYLIDEHDGSFFAVKQNYWRIFVSIKFWFSHFWEEPEIIVTLYD